MGAHILVVDDSEAAAKEFARLIELRTSLPTIAVTTPERAVAAVREHPIMVAVLDQMMPIQKGTELFQVLRGYNPMLKGVMLTGEAAASDVGLALNMGFADYLEKGQVKDLPNRVLLQYTKFLVDRADSEFHAPLVLHERRSGFLWLRRSVIELIGEELVVERHIEQGSWQTLRMIRAGETVKISEKLEVARKCVFTSETEDLLKAQTGVNSKVVAKVKASIEAKLSEKFREEHGIEVKNSVEVVREFSLPAHPDGFAGDGIVARVFEVAPILRLVRCSLRYRCESCGSASFAHVTVGTPTGRMATRQVDQWRSNRKDVIDTGDVT